MSETGESASSGFFPAQPRTFPGRRAVKIGLRSLHVLAAGIYAGSHIFEATPDQRFLSVAAVLATGLLILLWTGGRHPWILAIIVLVSVISSHAPSAVRYFQIAGRGMVKGSETKG